MTAAGNSVRSTSLAVKELLQIHFVNKRLLDSGESGDGT